MNKKSIYAIGLMSGTSLDGLDIIYVRLEPSDYDFEIISSVTIGYSEEWKHRLKSAFYLNSKDDIALLDTDFAAFIGNEVNSFVKKNKISNLDFIASHGHTIFHQPEQNYTLQIGNGQVLSNMTNCLVVNDFRTQDVELGGQGAPLVPIGDQILFSTYDACINLGGFANISFERDQKRIAFDICPVNIVLNEYSKRLGLEFDEGGVMASGGKIDLAILEQLNSLSYYKKEAPKSLGFEWVEEAIFPLFSETTNPADVLRTYVEHTAIQIAKVILNFKSTLFTGGGVYNHFLLERIESHSFTKIVTPNDQIINYKEALVFALLGLLKLQNKTNCLSSVTGAVKNHSSGRIFRPNTSD